MDRSDYILLSVALVVGGVVIWAAVKKPEPSSITVEHRTVADAPDSGGSTATALLTGVGSLFGGFGAIAGSLLGGLTSSSGSASGSVSIG